MTGWDDLVSELYEERTGRETEPVDIGDGGYLSWLYGSSTARMGNWPPPFLRGATIMMDSRVELRRKARSPHYKAKRSARRKESVEAQAKWQMVHDFADLIEEDPRFDFLRVDGLEADDLVALWAWKFGTENRVKVFAIDKDFLQLDPYLELVKMGGDEVSLGTYIEGLQKRLHGYGPLKPEHIPMILSLLGDSADSIPRLLARGVVGLDFLAHVLWGTDKPWTEIDREYPDAAANLYDVILPEPEVFGLDVNQVFKIVRDGQWHDGLLKKLMPPYKRMVQGWTPRS